MNGPNTTTRLNAHLGEILSNLRGGLIGPQTARDLIDQWPIKMADELAVKNAALRELSAIQEGRGNA